jgi:HK97 family phage major capsid protein
MSNKLITRLSAIKEEATGLRSELADLVEADELSEEQEARFSELTSAEENPIRALEAEAADIEKRLEILKAADKLSNVEIGEDRGAPRFNKNDSPYEDRLDNQPKAELRGRALKAVEETNSFELDDRNKERVTHILENRDDKYGNIAKLVLATGSRKYKEAWTKAVTGQDMALDSDERQMLARAMSLTNGAGGFAVPFPVDPTLIQLGDGSSNPFRQISRVEQITTDSWQGLASTEMSASWDGEAGEVSDDTTTFTQPSVTAHKAQAFVPA